MRDLTADVSAIAVTRINFNSVRTEWDSNKRAEWTECLYSTAKSVATVMVLQQLSVWWWCGSVESQQSSIEPKRLGERSGSPENSTLDWSLVLGKSNRFVFVDSIRFACV